ncbi:unnamed protein product [Periconia digitata]|uniref:Uncharacterized protein n=1 Tax=Periconia digitata TaxID=1303443 RepID=A0A9W4UBS4_9PLEO|nr:unnamed protein product [Periconia digitata]
MNDRDILGAMNRAHGPDLFRILGKMGLWGAVFLLFTDCGYEDVELKYNLYDSPCQVWRCSYNIHVNNIHVNKVRRCYFLADSMAGHTYILPWKKVIVTLLSYIQFIPNRPRSAIKLSLAIPRRLQILSAPPLPKVPPTYAHILTSRILRSQPF